MSANKTSTLKKKNGLALFGSSQNEYDNFAHQRKLWSWQTRVARANRIDVENKKISHSLAKIRNGRGLYHPKRIQKEASGIEQYRRNRAKVRKARQREFKREKQSIKRCSGLQKNQGRTLRRLIKSRKPKHGHKRSMSTEKFTRLYRVKSMSEMDQNASMLGFRVPTETVRRARAALMKVESAQKAKNVREAKYRLDYNIPCHNSTAKEYLATLNDPQHAKINMYRENNINKVLSNTSFEADSVGESFDTLDFIIGTTDDGDINIQDYRHC